MAATRVNLTVEPTAPHHILYKVELRLPLVCCWVNVIVVGVGVVVAFARAPTVADAGIDDNTKLLALAAFMVLRRHCAFLYRCHRNISAGATWGLLECRGATCQHPDQTCRRCWHLSCAPSIPVHDTSINSVFFQYQYLTLR